MYWSPNFLAVVFKKQEISQQVVIRMQDLTSGFSQIFRGSYPRTLTAKGGGATPSRTEHPDRPSVRCGAQAPRSGVGTQTLVPLNFSAVVAPLRACVNNFVFAQGGTTRTGTRDLSTVSAVRDEYKLFQADYITVVEDRPIMSVKYCDSPL